jgi:hypothetical protein
MKITAYNQHDVGSSHEPWSCSSQTTLLAMGQRRYAIKRSTAASEASHRAQSKDPYALIAVINDIGILRLRALVRARFAQDDNAVN